MKSTRTLIIVVIVLFALFFGLNYFFTRDYLFAVHYFTIPKEKYCIQDGDCVCGTQVNTDYCIVGNKNYVVNNGCPQVPDFCGLAGIRPVSCVNNECK